MSLESFLDHIPEEVNKKIATFIVAGPKEDVISFSRCYESHRHAIALALDGKLTLTDDERNNLEDWLSVTGKAILELNTHRLLRHHLPECFQSLPNLREASICSSYDQLRAIRNSPFLFKLSVSLQMNTNWELFVETVAGLPLKYLTLSPGMERGCVLRNVGFRRLLKLPAVCPFVATLDVSCGCVSVRGSPFPHWRLVTAFKALESLVIHNPFIASQLHFLRQLKDVQILSPMPVQDVLRIGSHVSTIWQLRRACAQTVSLLDKFSRIRELRLRVLNSAEVPLSRAAGYLEFLQISWGYDPYYDEAPITAYQDGNVTVDKDIIEFYAPDEAVIEEIVRNAPNLRVLGLFKARIRIHLVEKIMKLIGRRLEVLGVELVGQEEPVSTRVERILVTAAQFCPNIKHIEIPRTHDHFTVPMTTEQRDSCRASLNLIKRNSPFFREEDFMIQFNYCTSTLLE